MTAPDVTVIVAAYNCAATLPYAIRSVLAQTFERFELWVVGDACTDESERVVASFGDPRVHWANLPHHFGSQSGPNNEGIRRASGRYVAYLGQDDLWFPTHLSALVTVIESSGAAFVHGSGVCLGPAGVYRRLAAPRGDESYRTVRVPPSCCLHRRDLIDVVGPWSNHRSLATGVDDDFLLRVVRARQRIAFSPALSILKFPAARFATYAIKHRPPQADYFDEMQRDPSSLRQTLLADIARLPAAPPPSRWHRLAGRAWGSVRRLLGRADRSQPSARAVARFQRRRRAALVRKGLPPTADGNPSEI